MLYLSNSFRNEQVPVIIDKWNTEFTLSGESQMVISASEYRLWEHFHAHPSSEYASQAQGTRLLSGDHLF